MRVLIVENDNDMMFLVTEELRRDTTIELMAIATDAEEALESAAAGPDVIVLDNFLDDSRTGASFAAELKEVAPGSKILLFSDYDLSITASTNDQIDGFLPKSRIRELIGTLHGLIE